MGNEKFLTNFVNFDEEQLNVDKKNGIICIDSSQLTTQYLDFTSKFSIQGIPLFLKDVYFEIGEESAAIFEVAISKIMNECGVNSIPYFPVFKKVKNGKLLLCSFSQDIHSLKNLIVTPGNCSFWFDKPMKKRLIVDQIHNNEWYFLEIPEIKNYLLNFMTEECFEQLIDQCLIDELVGQNDRHLTNYFFFKFDNSEKLEGIISYDNALTWIFESKAYNEKDKIGFDNNLAYFVYRTYSKKSNTGLTTRGSYADRVNKICEFFDKGLIGERQANLIKKYIESDIVSKLQKEANRCETPISPAVIDLYARVTEYLEQNLQRQL